MALNEMEQNNAAMRVKIWDLGPKKPVAPKRPVAPKGKEGDPEFDLLIMEFKETLEDYGVELKAYGAAKKDFADWHKRWGGPYEIEMWSVDAHDALMREPKRYVVSDRRLDNHGLPEGVKPGRGHHENIRRQEEELTGLAAAKRADPQFGAGAPA